METDFESIKPLLHDATMAGISFARDVRRIAVRLKCLRRNEDGSELADPHVVFEVDGVTAVGFSFESQEVGVRPSLVRPPTAENALAEMERFAGVEGFIELNAPGAENVALSGLGVCWIDGCERDFTASAQRLLIIVERVPSVASQLLNYTMIIGGVDLRILSDGAFLPIEQWKAQFAAWWDGWKEHWKKASDDPDNEFEDVEYDVVIPAGEDPAPDLTYRPPNEPVFALQPTDVPQELLVPVRDWFEGHHQRDWLRMARAFPLPATPESDRAAELAEMYEGPDLFGCWEFAREVDEWWVEDRRAAIRIWGVEHFFPVDEYPATNSEHWWTFDLHRADRGWIIRRYSSGSVGSESEPKADQRSRVWATDWKSGPIE